MYSINIALLIAGVIYLLSKFLLWYLKHGKRVIDMTSDIQAPARNWFWGSLHLFPPPSEKQLHWFHDLSVKYGDIYKLWWGPFKPYIYLCSPRLCKDILQTSEPKPIVVPGYGCVEPWLGMGLLLSSGELWHRNRHLLTPAFHFEMLRTYLKVFNQANTRFMGVCDRLALSGESFDVFKPAGLLSLDVVLQCVFSYYSGIQELGENHRVVRLTDDAITLAMERGYRPYLWPNILFYLSPTGRRFKKTCDEFHAFTKDIIDRRKRSIGEGKDEVTRRRDFLDMLLSAKDEDGRGLAENEIEAEVNSFLFAGHDTTSAALSWVLYSLATHPEHQDACRREIQDILHDRPAEDLSREDLGRLKHQTLCIKESMRLHGTVPYVARRLSRDLVVGEHTLPKDVFITMFLFLVHRHPDAWDNPDEFIPERFLPDEAAGRDAFAFVPFSAGPRNCIGQNFAMNLLKVSLSRILLRYRVYYDESHPVKKKPLGVMVTEEGLWLKLERL